MRRSSRTLLLALVAAGTLALTACSGAGSGSSNAASHKHYKLEGIAPILGVPYISNQIQGGKEAAKALGDTLDWVGPATPLSATQQVALVNTAIQKGYNAISITAADSGAVAPVLKRAQTKGLKVVTANNDIPDTSARSVFVSPPESKQIAQGMLDWVGGQMDYAGDFGVLSSTPTKAEQVGYINDMKALLKTSKYSKMKLVTIAYGNENSSQDVQQTQSMLQAYPDLKAIISPTAVGLPDAARAVQLAGKCGQVAVSGLGTPNTLKSYVKSDCVKEFGLWSPADIGYLQVETMHALLDGTIKGRVGESFKAGRLGQIKVVRGATGSTVRLSDLVTFTKDNIDKYDF